MDLSQDPFIPHLMHLPCLSNPTMTCPQLPRFCSGEAMLDVETDYIKNSIRDARTPQPGEIVFNTMRYRSSETVQRSGYF